MWSHRVIASPPPFDDDLGFFQRAEDFAVEQFVTKRRVEALTIALLPRAARHDIGGSGTNGCNPFAQILGDELGAIVGTNVAWDASQNEQVEVTDPPC